jgi:hypothetical protein
MRIRRGSDRSEKALLEGIRGKEIRAAILSNRMHERKSAGRTFAKPTALV